jgi:hypothetical protein
MLEAHNIVVPQYEDIIEEIERRTGQTKEYKLSRQHALDHVGSFLTIYIDILKKHLTVKPP